MKILSLQPKSGQVAIMLVLIVVVLTTITTAVVAIGVSSTRDTTSLSIGEEALMISQSGAENAILRLLRNPSYVGEANLPIGAGSATIEVTGTGPLTVVSTGTILGMVRRTQVIVEIIAGKLTVTSWREI
ncbi:MAG: hypothetical protein WCG44_03065 [bacterium]